MLQYTLTEKILMSLSFVHFADLHADHNLGHVTKDYMPLRVLDLLRLVGEVVDYANQYQVDFILFAGDAYHRHNPNQKYKIALHAILNKATMPVHMIPGNHDMTRSYGSKDALYEFTSIGHPLVHVYHKPTLVDLGGIALLAIPWLYGDYDLPDGLDESNTIVMAHCTVPALANYNVDTSEYGLGREFIIPLDLLTGFKYVALGHIHTPNSAGNVYYPGSVGVHTWGEYHDPPHHFIHYVDGAVHKINYVDRPRYLVRLTPDDITLPPPIDGAIYRFVIVDDAYPINTLQKQYSNGIIDIQRESTRIERTRRTIPFGLEDNTMLEQLLFTLVTQGEDPNDYKELINELFGDALNKPLGLK